MKERPILFSGPMVKAILREVNPKTMTRRVIKKPSPLMMEGEAGDWCPYGQPGDRLWVREKALYWTGGAGGTSDVIYTDDPEIPQLLKDNNTLLMARETTNIAAGESVVGKWKWRPGIHMFRWASRILLEVTAVRVERVQEISDRDCEKEGLENPCGYYCDHAVGHVDHQGTINDFAKLWDSINAKRGYGWDANPWVWVVEFKRVVTNV